jgi:ubiquinone/menaquinone biosynthesis C-methylase UbiE
MSDWRGYDDVAETYERVHAPRFAQAARDLVAFAELGEGGRVLDVGTGTGVAAEALAGGGHIAVGIDESMGMLAVARRVRPSIPVAAAAALDLPFKNGAFDAAVGSFVLAHFTKVDTALYDILRVVRFGGRVAFSSWADRVDAYQETWAELVESVVPREILAPAYAEAAPWHDKFRHRGALEQVLLDAGLRHVRTEVTKYRWVYSLDDYLDGQQTWVTGRFVRDMLGDRGWPQFMARARATFAERFADPLNDFRDVILAVGTKPAP